ncbi:unnamed protein product [marine sediment metagenome]|uniref:Uncharacterized protein n=1 Tax=marine sediment metagenome TaxID=412755 RepID=X1CRH9_9ZZZZ
MDTYRNTSLRSLGVTKTKSDYMAEKKLYDNLYKVIKANSGAIAANDNTLTEIMDLQIPRGYAARIRKVIFRDHSLKEQVDQVFFKTFMALVLDPDDEETYQIPNFTVDHDVLCDAEHEYMRFEEDTTPNGISVVNPRETVYDFDETLDAVTVRNVRFNTQANGIETSDNTSQTRCIVYFTYEKVSMDLYSKLLGIS